MFVFNSPLDLINAPIDNFYFVYKGLERGYIGLLLAVPGAGKTHLIYSLVIELTTNKELLGLNSSEKLNKVLILSCEDFLIRNSLRLKGKVKELTDEQQIQLNDNLGISLSSLELVIPVASSPKAHKKHLDNVSKLLQGSDLIIVDTVSEILGMRSEVIDDRSIKLSFDYI